MKFRDRISHANPSLDTIPSGFKRYGHVMVLRSNNTLSEELGNTILKLYPWCKSVYQHVTTVGQSRIPHLQLLAGEDQPIVTHKENGVRYQFDVSQITFSGGNRHLRERLVEIVNDGEFLVDMFAAVGNLSLQPLVHLDIEALLVERNPTTFSYLQKTLKLNRLDPEIAINSDCRSLSQKQIADRVFMGYHDVNQSHLRVATQIAKSPATLHLHPIVPEDDKSSIKQFYLNTLSDLNREVISTESIKVKDYAPGMEHIEFIITLA